MSSYILRRCFGFGLKTMLGFVLATLVLWREGVHMQSVGEEGNAYRRLFLWLGQYWTTGPCPSFCLRIFSWLFWIVGSCSCLSSTQQLSPFTGQAVQTLKSRSESEGAGFYVLNCVEVHLAVLLQGETSQTEVSRTSIRIGLWRTIIGRRRHFCSERQTLTITDFVTDTNFAQWTGNKSWRTIVNVVHRFTGGGGSSGLRKPQPLCSI
jgi:hypothetical protein